MNIIALANETLSHIVFDNLSFATALNKSFNSYQVSSTNKSDLTSLLGSELRHHLIIKKFVSNYITDVDEKLLLPIYLALANKVYVHKFQESEMSKFAINFAKEDNVDLKEAITNLLNLTLDNISIFPNDIDNKSLEYLSYRFNIPSWVVKLWNNHYGHNIAFKQMKASHIAASYFVKVPANIDVDSSNYEKTNIDNVYRYLCKGSPKKDNDYIKNEFFIVKPPLNEVVDLLDIEPIKGIAVFTGYSNCLIDILTDKFNKDIEIDYISSDDRERLNTKREIAEKNYQHINLFACQSSGIITCISKPVHTFFVMPKSSGLDNLKYSPDFFLKIDNNKLDEIILDEITALNEASELVEQNGQLVYIVPTLNKKESLNIKDSFLHSHPDFIIEKEKQYFAFEDYQTSMYYVIFRKVYNND